MAASKTGKVPAVDRAFALLELLAGSNVGLSISTVARRLGVPKSSIHLIMATLESRGYLRKDLSTHKYSPGLRLTALANLTLEGFELQRSRHFLANLAESTGLTVHMAVLVGGEAVLVDRVQPPGSVQFGTWVGQRMHLNCTAVGKALLAFLPEEEFKRILQGKRLLKHNQHTISSIPKLREEMIRVRTAGYAVDNEEEEIGARCVGAPIFDYSSCALAAISVAGTTTQIPLERIDEIARCLRNTADKASRMFGYGMRR